MIKLRNDVTVGLYLQDTKRNTLWEIIEILPETPEKYGLPSFVSVLTPRNGLQKLSWSTINELNLINRQTQPELFL